jgi:hypothetical protein
VQTNQECFRWRTRPSCSGTTGRISKLILRGQLWLTKRKLNLQNKFLARFLLCKRICEKYTVGTTVSIRDSGLLLNIWIGDRLDANLIRFHLPSIGRSRDLGSFKASKSCRKFFSVESMLKSSIQFRESQKTKGQVDSFCPHLIGREEEHQCQRNRMVIIKTLDSVLALFTCLLKYTW